MPSLLLDSLGTVLPHRSSTPIDAATVARCAARAEALGFADLWVTENTVDGAFCLDPIAGLAFAAAHTQRVRLGVSVSILPVQNPVLLAHQWASLDHLSEGRAILGVGIGRDHHYDEFQVDTARRVSRFNEAMDLVRQLWRKDSDPRAGVDFQGDFYRLDNARMQLKPKQQPGIPIWIGGTVPPAIRRAARRADGWMGSGNQGVDEFVESIPILRSALDEFEREAESYPISKRVFMAVDERPERAKQLVYDWFNEVYHAPERTEGSGVFGTPEQVREQLEALVDAGANHLVLNAVADFDNQIEAIAEVAGLK